MDPLSCDVLIAGSGLSGLTTAYLLAEKGLDIVLITKKTLDESNSYNAQGGVASVVNFTKDSFEKHINDTVEAGVFLNNEDAVRFFVENGPDSIDFLKKIGVEFTEKQNGELDLGKEGGHSERRIVHAGDITGHEIIRGLTNAVLTHKNIRILENHTLIDLITTKKFMLATQNKVVGAYVLTENEEIMTISAKSVLLATGGCGKVYLYTSNPDVTSGDGIAVGFRAGLSAINMEMIQFHPTILYSEKITSLLISEALRGEGGVLKTKDGRTFMEKYHKLKSLAPRDVVARAIDFELKTRGDDCVYLDMTHLDSNFLKKRFPNIFKYCLHAGIDMSKEQIPVVPAAHYMCGGLKSSVKGNTEIPGLYVAGELAHTGLHGANRLASNSLLEAVVMGRFVAVEIDKYVKNTDLFYNIPNWKTSGTLDNDENVVIKQNWDEIRHVMWNYVGIVRSDKRLKRALKRINLIKEEITEYYWNVKISKNLLELRNLTLVAEIIIRSAMKRKESRGLHYSIDYPEISPVLKNTEILPEEI